MSESEIIFTIVPGRAGDVGLITLNRPQVLNALTLAMCRALDEQLADWAARPSIKAVIIRGRGERSFCAGGDLRYIYHQGGNIEQHPHPNIFWSEYRVNHKIFHFPKPYIALMHGITMGGGVGVSVHGSHRIAAENLSFAMPETAIGFFPDIGAKHFLSRCPGQLGIYLGLSGSRIQASDALYAGLIDSILPLSHFDTLIEAVAGTDFGQDPRASVTRLIANLALDKAVLPPSELASKQALIDTCFDQASIEAIVATLQKKGAEDPWCQQTLATLQRLSPSSLKITLAYLRQAPLPDFTTIMATDYRLACRFLESHDFMEGVRAAIIAKDQRPLWQPDCLEDVDDDLFAVYSRPFHGSKKELDFTNPS